MTETKKRGLIYNCAELEVGEFTWYEATCKKTAINSLEKAKALCEVSTRTSSIESEDTTQSDSADYTEFSKHSSSIEDVSNDIKILRVNSLPSVSGKIVYLASGPAKYKIIIFGYTLVLFVYCTQITTIPLYQNVLKH